MEAADIVPAAARVRQKRERQEANEIAEKSVLRCRRRTVQPKEK